MSQEITFADHGRALLRREPVIFHCNHFNYWLQNTLLLDASLGMADVIRAAAADVGRSVMVGVDGTPTERLAAASEVFRQLGFGRMSFAGLGEGGGEVHTPTSHYGQLLKPPGSFERPQNLFDQGFAQGVAASVFGQPYEIASNACHS
ncbi:MAG: hypothetical protein KC621_26135, partial [Myxococcales bacterium]|nr:hypothetical protein [Myxococcales bacterium]